MSDEKAVQKVNPVTALTQAISAAKDMKDLLSISAVRNRYIQNYKLGTGRADGDARYERDVFAFQEKVSGNEALMACDPFSIFAAFVKVGTYGVHPDKIYLQPQGVKQKDNTYKQIMKVSLDPFGKKELLERMPTIKRVNDPQLVFVGEEFEVDAIAKRVTKHKVKFPLPNPSEETVMAVWINVEFADRERDYWLSLEELKKRRAASKMQGGGALWGIHYGEAAKKSIINYLYKAEYKAPETQMIFPQYENAVEVNDEETTDANVVHQETLPTVAPDFNPNVNEQTGEEYQKEDKPKKPVKPDFM